jgi:hypothetical protein
VKRDQDDSCTWEPSLDAVVAAPAHHLLVYENEKVRVLRTQIQAGEVVPVHTHRWGGFLIIFSWSRIVRRDDLGLVTLDTRLDQTTPPLLTPQWQEALPPHSVENVGDTVFEGLLIEIKNSPEFQT